MSKSNSTPTTSGKSSSGRGPSSHSSHGGNRPSTTGGKPGGGRGNAVPKVK